MKIDNNSMQEFHIGDVVRVQTTTPFVRYGAIGVIHKINNFHCQIFLLSGDYIHNTLFDFSQLYLEILPPLEQQFYKVKFSV